MMKLEESVDCCSTILVRLLLIADPSDDPCATVFPELAAEVSSFSVPV